MTHGLLSGFYQKAKQVRFKSWNISQEPGKEFQHAGINATSTNLLLHFHLHDATAMTPDWMNLSSNPPVIFMAEDNRSKRVEKYTNQFLQKTKEQSFFFLERSCANQCVFNVIRSYFEPFRPHRMVSSRLTLMFIYLCIISGL